MVPSVGKRGGSKGEAFLRYGGGRQTDEDGILRNQDDGREIGGKAESGGKWDKKKERVREGKM